MSSESVFFVWSEMMFFMLKSLSLVGEWICLEGTFGSVFDFDSIQGFIKPMNLWIRDPDNEKLVVITKINLGCETYRWTRKLNSPPPMKITEFETEKENLFSWIHTNMFALV